MRAEYGLTGYRKLIQNSNFSRLFFGRVITDIGDSFYYIATMWLVWELTQSPFYTGLASALVQAPRVFRVLVGPLVDRWRLRSVLLRTQLINGLGVLIVPIVAILGHLSVWVILSVIPVLKFVNGFVYPAQNAVLPQAVDEEQLTKANSLFSTSKQVVDMIANAIGGMLIGILGAISLFVIDSVTFAVAAILFSGVSVTGAMDRDDEVRTNAKDDAGRFSSGYFSELYEGITYVRGSHLLPMLVGTMVVNFTLMAANAVFPAFADSFGGPETYGLLMAATAGGMLVGAACASFVENHSLSEIAIAGFPSSGILLFVAVAIPGVWATAAFFFLALIPLGVFNVVFFSLVQVAVDDAFLGRVTAMVGSLTSALAPVGSLFGGTVANSVGTETVLYGVGCAVFVLGLYFLVHPRLRALPTISEADESALELQ